MTNKKSTKKALVLSCLSLLLCMSMLVGTTFAWFTDSVSTTNNIITAGNLDVNLYWSTTGTSWAPVNAQTNIFKTETLWEPGHTEVVYLKVVNEGTLALKYDLIVNVASEIAGTNVAGESFNLSDYILYKVTPGITTYANSAAARGDESGNKLNAPYNTASQLLKQGEATELTMVVFMPTTVGNEANYLTSTAAPVINMGINLFATQQVKEQDSYGPDYDADAEPVVIYTAEELAKALTSDEEIISVILGNSIDLPRNLLIGGNEGDEYKMGGQSTKAIVIDLNGNKLNITTSYWSVLGTVNPETVVNIKDGTMTSSQATGTWNSYDLMFASGNFVFENVEFEKAIALETDATLKNVTINETHDYYAMWITAEGQTVTVNGLTVNSEGRGIKIDDQYVDAPAKVTLNVSNATFNTNKKAAIMVKSAAGADIALSNVNIANTPDTAHAVWVDEDAAAYYDLVTVTGGEKFNEGNVASDNASLKDAIAKGDEKIVLAAGTYTFPATSLSGDQTLICAPGTVFEGTSSLNANGATIVGATFSNPTGKVTNSTTVNGTFKNCTFVGSDALRYCYAGNTVVFEDCVFTANSVYAIHFDGLNGKDLTFKNCKITGWVAIAGGANSLIFDGCEIYGNGSYGLIRTYSNATIKNCTFDVSAVNTTDAYQDGIHAVGSTVNVENCTNVNGAIEDLFNISNSGIINKN